MLREELNLPQMESAKMKHSLGVIQEQGIAMKAKSENDRKTDIGVIQTRKKKSHKLRFNTSGNETNPMDDSTHKQRLPHPVNEGKPTTRIHKTESHRWKLQYKSYNKNEVLEKLKQEIYEKNVQRDLEFRIKSRIGFRSGDPRSASLMTRMGPDVTSLGYFKKRETVPKELHVDHEQKKDIDRGTMAAEVRDTRVKSSSRTRANTTPKNKNRVTVAGTTAGTSGPVHEGDKGDKRFLAHLEQCEIQETKISPHTHSPELASKYDEKRSEKDRVDDGHASTSAWVDNEIGQSHRYPSDTKVSTNEILEKYFASNIFPPLPVKSKLEEKGHGHEVDMRTSPVKCWTTTDQDTPATQSKPEDSSTKTNMTAWRKESNELRKKIKAFIEKPVPEIPPSSLLIHRRSTVADISMNGFSKAGSTSTHAPPPERKKSIGVVNIHTCPNVNVFTDRSWMYQDRRAEKCRYIRAPQTPIPPISEVFRPNEDD